MANIGASLKILESQVGQITKQLTSQPSDAVAKTANPNMREVNAVFIHHKEIGVVSREQKEVKLTPIRDEKPTPTKRVRDQVEVEFTEGTRTNIPQKPQNLVEFVVPCEIGGKLVEIAIFDSGASVNIMPSSLYEKLGLSSIKPTEVILQLADKSVKVPLGCVEDVELKIDKVRLPADFVVLDVENSKNVRIILGRPFLATAGAIIDLKQKKIDNGC
ncbi:uncharacterized protein [Primulina huaijiensis]|uniref:uncharacterized protein n=1 Tax=Primulina huaijiensis TaxID=1492673 RepID=UPI003CC78C1C